MANRRERRAAGKAAKKGGPTGAGPPRRIAPPPGSAPALLAQALGLYRSGRLAEAESAYRQVLELSPRDPDVLYQFGVLAGHTGRLGMAEQCLGEAVALRPREPAFHTALGLLLALRQRFADAVACHDRALALDNANVRALVGRGQALHELGDLAGAEAAYRRAAALAPAGWEIRFGWATVLTDLGRPAEAARIYREVVASNPKSAEANFNLGAVLVDLGRLDEAAACFGAALALKPDIAHASVNLVSALCKLGRVSEALGRAAEAMLRKPQPPDARLAFAAAIAHGAPSEYSPELCIFLEQCFEASDVQHDDLAKAAAWQLRVEYRLDPSPAEAASSAVEAAVAASGGTGILADRLLHLLLAKTVNRDRALEVFLTATRRRLCLADTLPVGLDAFLAALALQNFNNAYVFALDEAEEARVAALRAELGAELSRFAAPDATFGQKLLRYALYAPLTALEGAAALLRPPAESWPAPLGAVLDRCLREPRQEAELAPGIPSLGVIADGTSRAVRAQYEENPYPRWFSLPRPARSSLPAMLRRKFPHLSLPEFFAEPVEILVAGCGTGQQPVATALSFVGVDVLAVDLSRASLAYASRMARQLGVSNVTFLQADLLALGALERQFPMIEVVGVLHHMAEPIAGWRVLCGLLRPGGLMRVGLYSALARADIVAARERIAALGLAPTARDVRAFRQRVLFGAEAERFPRLALSKDLYDLNGCRDLLFHAKEHRYTLPELRAMLAALDLEFVGFEFATETVRDRYRADHPDDPTMTDLARWARFEEAHPDAFGMYVFWCRKPAG